MLGLSFAQFEANLKPICSQKFRAKQIWHQIHQKGARSFEDMTDLPAQLRRELSKTFNLDRLGIARTAISRDGTWKWLFSLPSPEPEEIEVVFIPEEKRGTLCISSQIGCPVACSFCYTGTQKLVRNLTVEEVIGQVITAKDQLGDWLSKPNQKQKITNLVFMGMGEPLLNYANLEVALEVLLDPEGLHFNKRKITVSTSGIVPYMVSCVEKFGVRLALSLHATNDELRTKIMPINKKYPLKELISTCKECAKVGGEKITLEYVMLKDVNDTNQDAKDLVRLMGSFPSKVNLIPFNPWPGSGYLSSSMERIEDFARVVRSAGYIASIRKTRGQDTLSACGQLKSDTLRKRRYGVST